MLKLASHVLKDACEAEHEIREFGGPISLPVSRRPTMLSLPTASPTIPREVAYLNDLDYLHDRMTKPQRHRLLHGYPLAAAMNTRQASRVIREVSPDPNCGRGLLIGVLPHRFCNPAITGCGFCTFAHEKYNT